MTTSNTGPAGPFTYSCAARSWWWSDPVFEIHGFQPGEVVPTTELLLAHTHPEDREAAERLTTALDDPAAFFVWHRVVDARERVRQLLTVGEPMPGRSGPEIRGCMVDVTEPLRRGTARELEEAVRASAAGRAGIEQAKGALMLAYGVGPDAAFELLRRCSQWTNVKVRALADAIVDEVAARGALPEEVRARCEAMLAAPDGGVARETRPGR